MGGLAVPAAQNSDRGKERHRKSLSSWNADRQRKSRFTECGTFRHFVNWEREGLNSELKRGRKSFKNSFADWLSWMPRRRKMYGRLSCSSPERSIRPLALRQSEDDFYLQPSANIVKMRVTVFLILKALLQVLCFGVVTKEEWRSIYTSITP